MHEDHLRLLNALRLIFMRMVILKAHLQFMFMG